MVSKIDIFHRNVNGTAPKHLTNYLNTSDNPVYQTQEHQTKTIPESLGLELYISNNRFSLSVSMNGTN